MSAVIEAKGSLRTLLLDAEALAKQHPMVAETHTVRGLILLRQGRPAEAYEAVNRSVSLDPDQPELQLHAGTLALQLGKDDAAAGHYTHAVRLVPDNPRYRFHLGQTLASIGQLDAARIHLDDSIRLDSQYHAAMAALAEVHHRRGEIDQAVALLSRAVRLAEQDVTSPGSTNPPARRLVAYRRQQASLLLVANRPDHALQVLRLLPAKEQFDPDVMDLMSECFIQLGRAVDAAVLFEDAAESEPTSVRYLAGAARARLAMGSLSLARWHIEALRKLNPNAAELVALEAALTHATTPANPAPATPAGEGN